MRVRVINRIVAGFRTLHVLGPVAGRYAGLTAQFLLTVLITRETTLATAGQYFALFAVVSVSYTTVGLGVSDGLVQRLPTELVKGDISPRGYKLIKTTAWFSLCSSLLIGLVVLIVVSGLRSGVPVTMLLVLIWWFGYSMVFLCAQILVAIGRTQIGTVVAYVVINVASLLSVGLYVLNAEIVDLNKILYSAVLGTLCASMIATALVIVLVRAVRPHSGDNPSSRPHGFRENDSFTTQVTVLMRNGTPMMLARLGQASVPWIPVWVFVTFGEPEAAAVYAAASRIIVIATAVIAALRFSSRHEIVLLLHASRWRSLVKLSFKSSCLSAATTSLVLLVVVFAGPAVIPLVFGSGYAQSTTLVIILLVATLGEALGGLSDEILKMMGRTYIVILSLLGAQAVQFLFSFFGSLSADPVVAAWGTVCAFFTLYIVQVLWLWPVSRSIRRSGLGLDTNHERRPVAK